ncbi:prepilin peptidase [Pectobacterium carotovorum]|nr:Type IV leader peptidase family protein [Pectobacterium carotovorum]
MNYFSCVLIFFPVLFFCVFPILYKRTLNDFVSSYDSVIDNKKYNDKPYNLPLFSVSLLLSLSVAIFHYRYGNLTESFFLVSLAMICYADIHKQWVPDFLIYILCWVSAYHVFVEVDLTERYLHLTAGVALYLIFLSINLFSRVRVFYSGDLYLLFPVGIYLSFYSLPIFIFGTLLTTLMYAWLRKKESMPFVPHMYVVFLLCRVIYHENYDIESFFYFL